MSKLLIKSHQKMDSLAANKKQMTAILIMENYSCIQTYRGLHRPIPSITFVIQSNGSAPDFCYHCYFGNIHEGFWTHACINARPLEEIVNILFWLLSFHPAANIIMQFPNCTHISQ
jgi:hypothetical protein